MSLIPSVASRLDAWLYRYPFSGASASRFAAHARRGFGDLDERLLASMHGDLARARTVLDVGAGPAVFTHRLAVAHPALLVLALEPSDDFRRARVPVHELRARAESLPLADASIDVAICLTSLRHVADRQHALRELRRVVAPAGSAHIVEIDPVASRRRIRNHARRIDWWPLRLTFGPLVVRTAPPAHRIASAARGAGWTHVATVPDPSQPVYVMRLS